MKFYGQFDPPVDKVLYEYYFQNNNTPGFFVECGAYDGVTESSCKFFEETLDWKGINIEPSPLFFQKLELNRPKSINLNLALSDKNIITSFQQVIHPEMGEFFGWGSLCHTSEHKQQLIDEGCTFKTYMVRTITWRNLIKEYRIEHVDLLVLDVEGTEREVIEGMRNSEVLPKILCIEHEHLGVKEVKALLKSLGYKYNFSEKVNSFFTHSDSPRKIIDLIKGNI